VFSYRKVKVADLTIALVHNPVLRATCRDVPELRHKWEKFFHVDRQYLGTWQFLTIRVGDWFMDLDWVN
jgi:hypothetical protein